MRLALTTLLLLLAAAAPARAAPVGITIAGAPRDGAILGEDTRIAGVVTRDGAPLPGQLVTLEGRAHPFDGPFRPRGALVTGRDGGYRFEARLRRNEDVRVVTAGGGAASRTLRVYVFPRATLTAETVRRNVVRLTQTLTVPSNVRLTAPTRFYLGRSRAETAPFRVAARPRRVRSGLYRARASVRVPVRYGGRFSYAACFRATPGAGLGDPKAGCPRSAFRF